MISERFLRPLVAPERARSVVATLAAALSAASLSLGWLAAAPASAGAAQTVGVAVTQVTGTAPFDSAAGPGKDTDATDNVIRSNDAVSYLVQLNVNDPGGGSSTATNVTVTQRLPAGMQWTRLPATCLTGIVVPPSAISPDGQTITCNIGDVPTGKAVTVTLSANVIEMRDGTVLQPDPVSVAADLAPAATATPDPVVVSSIPRIDMVKSAPQVSTTVYGGHEGYLLSFPVRVEIPNFGGRGLIGYEPPAAAMSLNEDYSNVSPNAEFVSCGPDKGGTWTCPAAGSPSPLSIGINVTDPNQIKSGTLSSTTVTIFVPKSDLVESGGSLVADNLITDLVATDAHGNAAEGEIDTNNRAKVTLSLDPKTGFGIYKRYVDVTAPGRHIPGGSNVDRNGFSTVGVGQIYQAEVRVSASNAAAGYEQVASCDVFDGTSQKMTLLGPAASASYGKGSPAWITANSVPGELPLKQGEDFVLEYSSVPTSTAADDATRWADLAATGCADSSGPWTSTPPATEAAANAVKRVRLRFIGIPPKQYSLTFAVNLAATSGADGSKIANFATYDVGAGWVASTYNPETHKGSRGDRLILTSAQVKLAKDILVPVTPATGTPNVRPGEELKFGLRPRVFAPSQSVSPAVVTARDVVVTDILPAGITLSNSPGHAPTPTPASVTRNPDGTTTIIWRLGTLTSNDTPLITYWAKVANTAGGSKVNNSYVTSPDDVGSPTKLITGTTDPHFAARTITVDSLGGIQVEKEVITPHIEPGDAITFSITYANLDQVDRYGMDLIDVLPYNGDGAGAVNVPGRNVPSKFHGSVRLKAVTGNDVDLIRYTDASPAAVYALQDPSISGVGHDALPAGKKWCTAAEISAGGAGCPNSIATSTAIRINRNEFLGANETATFTYSFDTPGSRAGDVYSNTAALRSDGLVLGTLSPTKTAKVFASRIGDFVWNDRNRNGRHDRGERGVAGVRVVLDGTDKHGRKIKVSTTTDARGRYLFTSSTQAGQNAGAKDLVSGSYKITFVRSSLPKGTVFTVRLAGPAGNATNSKPYPANGQTAFFRLADPSPSGVDGENLTLDAGVVIPPAPVLSVRPAPNFTG